MKTDVNGCSTCLAGQEQYEVFIFHGKPYFQYEYRHIHGGLFSTISPSLDVCRTKRDEFIRNQDSLDDEAEFSFYKQHPELNP